MNPLYRRNIISINDLQLSEIELLLKVAKGIQQGERVASLQDKLIASCFFEPSTRTRLSFEAAVYRLEGKVMGFSSEDSLSIKKGETLADTIQMLCMYADMIILRHKAEGSARFASQIASCPIINAGDGANQHPTQALIDLFTIQSCQPHLNDLSIALVGDLKFGRAVHSFIQVCSWFNPRLYLVAPQILSLPDALCDGLKKRGIRFSFHQNLPEVIPKVDVLYMTRIQQERFAKSECSLVKDEFILSAAMLKEAKPNLKILHPLPRVNEIMPNVDQTSHAFYFQQAKNGLAVRQALLSLILNEEIL